MSVPASTPIKRPRCYPVLTGGDPLFKGQSIMVFVDDVNDGAWRIECSECGGESDSYGTTISSPIHVCPWCAAKLTYPEGASW